MSTVLIVEDDEMLGRMLCRWFEKVNVEVFWAKKADDVWEALKVREYDLVMMDVMLPGIDGLDILEKMKMDESMRNIPVVMLSNVGEQEVMDRAMRLGAEDYVLKSNVEMDKLVKKMHEKYLH